MKVTEDMKKVIDVAFYLAVLGTTEAPDCLLNISVLVARDFDDAERRARKLFYASQDNWIKVFPLEDVISNLPWLFR